MRSQKADMKKKELNLYFCISRDSYLNYLYKLNYLSDIMTFIIEYLIIYNVFI